MEHIGIFLHIPRTGGTTMRLLMEQNYREEEIVAIYGSDIDHPDQALRGLRAAPRMIRGHIPYGVHDAFPMASYYYFTVIRDPVDRVWSLWKYMQRSKAHPLHGAVMQLKTLGSVLDSGLSVEFNNGMCRQLSGLDGPLPQRPYQDTLVGYGEDCSVLLNACMAHYRDRDISFGRLDDLESMVYMLSKVFRWRVPNLPGTAANAGPKRKPGDLTERELVLIHQLNDMDYELWKSAVPRGADD